MRPMAGSRYSFADDCFKTRKTPAPVTDPSSCVPCATMVWPASRGWRARPPVSRSTPSCFTKPTNEGVAGPTLRQCRSRRKRRHGKGSSKALDSANLSQNNYGSFTNLQQNKKSERGDPVQITLLCQTNSCHDQTEQCLFLFLSNFYLNDLSSVFVVRAFAH